MAEARLLSEPVPVAAIALELQKEVLYKPLLLTFRIRQDGSVNDCKLLRPSAIQELSTKAGRAVAVRLCKAIEQRRYEPVERELQLTLAVGRPHLSRYQSGGGLRYLWS